MKKFFSRQNLSELTGLTLGQLEHLDRKGILTASSEKIYTCRYTWNDVLVARIFKYCLAMNIPNKTVYKIGEGLQKYNVLDYDFAHISNTAIGLVTTKPRLTKDDTSPTLTLISTLVNKDGGEKPFTPIILIQKMNQELIEKAEELELIESGEKVCA